MWCVFACLENGKDAGNDCVEMYHLMRLCEVEVAYWDVVGANNVTASCCRDQGETRIYYLF